MSPEVVVRARHRRSHRVEVRVSVDLERDVNVSVPGNGLDEVRRDAEFEEKRDHGVSEVVNTSPESAQASPARSRSAARTF